MDKILTNIAKYNFNSENHLVEILALKLGVSKQTAKKQYLFLKQNNQVTFEGTKVIILDEKLQEDPFNNLPKYWVSTSLHPDVSLRLRERDLEILRFIDNGLRMLVDKEFYMMAETISMNMNRKYSEYEVRKSLHRMAYWFGEDFYRKPKFSERRLRTYKKSRSYTIRPPKKEDRKKLIENKLKEVLGDYVYEIPYLVDDNALKRLETVNNNRRLHGERRYDIKEFGKLLVDKKRREDLMHRVREVVMELRKGFMKYYNKIMDKFEGDLIQDSLAHKLVMLFERNKGDLQELYELLKDRGWNLSRTEWWQLYNEYDRRFALC